MLYFSKHLPQMQSHAIKATTRPEKRLESSLFERCMQGGKMLSARGCNAAKQKRPKNGDGNNQVLNTQGPVLHS